MAPIAASLRVALSHLLPWRGRPERRFPADWWLPGHWPPQDARCPAVGKTDMSAPISARMFSALRVFTPGIVHSNSIAGASQYGRVRLVLVRRIFRGLDNAELLRVGKGQSRIRPWRTSHA